MQNKYFCAGLICWVIACAYLPGAIAEPVVPIVTHPLSDSLYLLVGRGGNVAVSTGPDGTFVVDDQYASQYAAIKSAIAEIAPEQPAKYVLNTHWHSDHSGSNEQLHDAGAIIIAHDNVRQRLSTDQVIEFFKMQNPARAASALPVISFSRDMRFHLNGETLEIFHVEHAHTDGDAVIHFKNANVIHTGDVFFHGRYPFIDSGTGGSIGGMIAGVERILALCDEYTRIIPGHGELTDKQGLRDYLTMLQAVQKAISTLIVSGSNVEEVVLAKPTQAFDAKWGGGFLNPETFTRLVFEDIKRSTLR